MIDVQCRGQSSANTHEPVLISFSIPGAGTGTSQGTFPTGINASLTITGHFVDSAGTSHGFVVSPGSKVVTFDVPGAGTGTSQGTYPVAINTTGMIIGYFSSPAGSNGFVRIPDGTITAINYPGTDNGYPGCINSSGLIAGVYSDALGIYHGMVRDPNGAFISFDVPGVSATPYGGPGCYGINAEGAITGSRPAR